MTSVGTAVLAALCALAFATILSRRTTLTAKPMPDRWHVRATPITGGVAIFAGLLVALQPAIFARAIDSRYLPVVLGIAGAFAVGLVDDVRTLTHG